MSAGLLLLVYEEVVSRAIGRLEELDRERERVLDRAGELWDDRMGRPR